MNMYTRDAYRRLIHKYWYKRDIGSSKTTSFKYTGGYDVVIINIWHLFHLDLSNTLWIAAHIITESCNMCTTLLRIALYCKDDWSLMFFHSR